MNTSDFDFDLPEELIAQHPSGVRGQDKLMLLGRNNGDVQHFMMDNLPELIQPGTLMVFNNSRVRRARVYGIKETTGRETEFMFLNTIDKDCLIWNTMVKNAKKQKPGMHYKFPDGTIAQIVEHEGNAGTEFRALKFDFPIDENWFEKNGHIPLPPYIKREDNWKDETRYQTVYAKKEVSVAAPTAGLHFTPEILERIKNRGIEIYEVTLHVGAGTFLPVRSEEIENHHMHTESYEIPVDTARKLNQAKQQGKTIIAVGTTSIRTLESASDEKGVLSSLKGDTSIFIYPGYKFKFVDNLLTNFHTPESTLLMLVSALEGKDHIMNAYEHAVKERYRFFSYGDAMFIKGQCSLAKSRSLPLPL